MVGDSIQHCDSCSMMLEPIARYGSSEDSLLLTGIPKLARFSDGRLIAYVDNVEQPVLIYAAGKQPVRLGKTGEGPGEYKSVRGVHVGLGDSLYLTHDGNRISVFDRSGQFSRSATSEARLHGAAVPQPADRFIVAGMTRSRKGPSRPLHLIDGNSKVLKSFGPLPIYGMSLGNETVVSVAPGGALWVADIASNYLVYQVDAKGAVGAMIAGDSPKAWHLAAFFDVSQRDSANKGKKSKNVSPLFLARPDRMPIQPASMASGIFADASHLTVSFLVAAENWADIPLEYGPPGGEASSQALPDTEIKLYRTAVDVIDVQSRKLIDRSVFPGYGSVLNDGTLAVVRADSDGVFYVEVFRMKAKPPRAVQ